MVIDSDNQNPELVNSYDTLEEASKAIKNCNTTIRESFGGAGKYYLVEEYYIEENVYVEILQRKMFCNWQKSCD